MTILRYILGAAIGNFPFLPPKNTVYFRSPYIILDNLYYGQKLGTIP